MNTIHLSTAQAMLQRPDPVDLVVWRSSGKNAGELLHYDNCISLRYDYYEGTRTVKLLNSNEIVPNYAQNEKPDAPKPPESDPSQIELSMGTP